MTFSIDMHQDTLVKKLKPAVVKVYDYYEPGNNKKIYLIIAVASKTDDGLREAWENAQGSSRSLYGTPINFKERPSLRHSPDSYYS